MKVTTSAKRLQELIDYFNIKQIDLCKKTGIPKSTMSSYFSGEREPKQDRVSDISEAYGINETWLMGYDAPMFTSKTNIVDIEFSKRDSLVDSITRNAKKLNNSGKQNLLDYSNVLLGNPAYVEDDFIRYGADAAHARTDIPFDEDDDDPYDDKIMNDENF